MGQFLDPKSCEQINPPTLPRLGQGRAGPGITVGVERCFLSKPPSTAPLPLTCFGLPKLLDASLRPPSPQPRPPWIELRLALPMLRQWFDGISAGILSGFMGFQNWRMAPCPGQPSPQPRPPWIELRLALPMLRQWFDGLSAATLSSFMGFQNWRMAPYWAAAGFTHAAAMVWWDFGWHPVWFYGISKLTDGPLSRSQSLPHSRDLLGLSCGWLYPCCSNGLMGFRLAPCLVLWVSKLTDGPLSRSQSLPYSRDPIGLSCGWL